MLEGRLGRWPWSSALPDTIVLVLIWLVVPGPATSHPSAFLTGEGAVLLFILCSSQDSVGKEMPVLLAAGLPAWSAAASPLASRVVANGCPLPCLSCLCISFAIREDRIISPWNPINYQV